MSAAAPAIEGAEITSAAKLFPMRAASLSDAYLATAARVMHGYFTGHLPALKFHVEVEDTSTHRMVLAVEATGGVLDGLEGVAQKVDPQAQPFSSSNPEAVAAWGRHEFERAVALDPDFGEAWLRWTETLASHGDAQAAMETAARALARPSLKSEVDRTRLELTLASLRQDPDARVKALDKLAKLVVSDPALLESLATAEVSARRFSSAVEVLTNLVKIDPDNVAAMNSLGYAQAFAGNLDAARSTFEQYGRQPGQKPNALDSLGEAHFMNGRFSEAEKYFLQAQEANPTFLGGSDLMKAAYARWMRGDLAGADGLMKRYLDARKNDPLRNWREAIWEYATGRREQAAAILQTVPDRQIVEKQQAAWKADASTDLAAMKEKYEHMPPSSDGQARTFYAAALIAAGRKEEARPLLTRWPLPGEAGGDPFFESQLFPKFLEARKAVGL